MFLQKVTILAIILQLLTVYGDSTKKPKKGCVASPLREDGRLIVTSIENAPFLTMKPGHIFDGYIPDLMQLITEKTNITFTFKIVSDLKYGIQLANGSWTGMVGELINEVAAVAAAPLTVSEDREPYIDFTVPFMSVNLSLVMLKNAEIKISNLDDLISHKADVKVGTILAGRTMQFFQTTEDPTLKQVNMMLNSDSSNFARTIGGGTARVRRGNGRYTFIATSDMAEHYAKHPPCTLTKIDIMPDYHEYALAVKKGSNLKNILDRALVELRDEGALDMLKRRWWRSECTRSRISVK